MKRNRPGVMPEITREIYKGVKKFDRQQFQRFCAELYAYGFEDGRESVTQVDVEELLKALAAVRGIGPTTLSLIRRGLIQFFEGEKGEQNP